MLISVMGSACWIQLVGRVVRFQQVRLSDSFTMVFIASGLFIHHIVDKISLLNSLLNWSNTIHTLPHHFFKARSTGSVFLWVPIRMLVCCVMYSFHILSMSFLLVDFNGKHTRVSIHPICCLAQGQIVASEFSSGTRSTCALHFVVTDCVSCPYTTAYKSLFLL